MSFAGNHAKITESLPAGRTGGTPGDFRYDGHGTVTRTVNDHLANPTIKALLSSWGWSGSEFTSEDVMYTRQHRVSASGPSMHSVLWQAGVREGIWGAGLVVVGEPAPPVTPNAPVDPKHQHSAKYTGWKREVVYALESSATAFAEGIDAALAEGRVSQAERDSFIAKRLSLLMQLLAVAEVQADNIRPGEPVNNPEFKGQAECDAIWDYANIIREQMARKDLGFFKSEANRLLVDGLKNMSGVALSLGLKGKKLSYLLFGQPYETRDSEYVTGFYSWSAQDPVAKKIGDELGAAEGGLWIGGQQG